MRLIDKDALIQALKKEAPPPTTDDLYTVNLLIVSAPIIDAIPVSWITAQEYGEDEELSVAANTLLKAWLTREGEGETIAEHSFQEVMKQFDRMCWYYQQKRECPMACPMKGMNISQCRKIAFEEPKVAEQTVMQWAAEHPKPVYPTWAEYLTSIGVYPKGWEMYQTPLKSEIPADIAQKLGLKPKEG